MNSYVFGLIMSKIGFFCKYRKKIGIRNAKNQNFVKMAQYFCKFGTKKED